MVSLSGLWTYCLAPGRLPLLFLSARPLLLLLVFTVSSSPESCFPHSQTCHILARIGHTVRLGALLPTRQPARIQNALNRALASLRHQGGGADSSTTPSQTPPLLPYNLSLEVVARTPAGGDPESLSRSACQDLVVRGVSAVLAFPRSREELIQVEFLSSFLEIPFISILEDTEPLVTKVWMVCVLLAAAPVAVMFERNRKHNNRRLFGVLSLFSCVLLSNKHHPLAKHIFLWTFIRGTFA